MSRTITASTTGTSTPLTPVTEQVQGNHSYEQEEENYIASIEDLLHLDQEYISLQNLQSRILEQLDVLQEEEKCFRKAWEELNKSKQEKLAAIRHGMRQQREAIQQLSTASSPIRVIECNEELPSNGHLIEQPVGVLFNQEAMALQRLEEALFDNIMLTSSEDEEEDENESS